MAPKFWMLERNFTRSGIHWIQMVFGLQDQLSASIPVNKFLKNIYDKEKKLGVCLKQERLAYLEHLATRNNLIDEVKEARFLEKVNFVDFAFMILWTIFLFFRPLYSVILGLMEPRY